MFFEQSSFKSRRSSGGYTAHREAMMERHQRICYCMLTLSLVIATASLVLSIIVLARPNVLISGNGMTASSLDQGDNGGKHGSDQQPQQVQELSSNEKVYVFGYDVPWGEYQYVSADGNLRGLSIDIVSAVCWDARKRCEHIVVPIQDCWDQERSTGIGLLGRWFDACAVFLKTVTRRNIFGYSGSFYRPKLGQFYTKSSRSLDISDLPTLTVGVRSQWYVGPGCMTKNNIEPKDIVKAKDYEEVYSLISNNTVDIVFVEEGSLNNKSDLISLSETQNCALGGSGVMHRVDSDIAQWFEPAFERIKRAGKFKEMCDKYMKIKDDCLH